jgi:hypothetical protein
MQFYQMNTDNCAASAIGDRTQQQAALEASRCGPARGKIENQR